MKTKHAPTINDYVSETSACGFAGFCPSNKNRAHLRSDVPHTIEMVNGHTSRRYQVSDLLEFKRINKISHQ